MRIDGMSGAGTVKIQADLGELGLKDGQNILGRIISVTDNTVLLQLAGKTLPAQLEGRPLLPGTVVLFKVSLAQTGKVELKVLATPGPQVPGVTPETVAPSPDAGNQTAIMAASRKLNWEIQPEQLVQIDREMRAFATQHGSTPAPEVFVWLKMQNWPVTPGTVLLAWLYRDQGLRNLIWSRLRWLAQAKRQPEMLPPVLDLEPEQLLPTTVTTGKFTAAGVRTVLENQASTKPGFNGEPQNMVEPLPGFGVSREEQPVLGQLRSLLEQSTNLDRSAGNSSVATTAIIPFLIQTAATLVTELRLEWSDKPARSGDSAEREELVRMVIPTENLGEIHLAMLVGVKRTQINFKVASPAVQDYFCRHLEELKSQLDKQTQIAVSLIPKHSCDETKVDLWM